MCGIFSVDMGIDLGTANTLVYVRGDGIVLNEPSVVAVQEGTNKVLLDGNAVGLEAKRMIGKCHSKVQTIRPMKDGVIADYEITEAMLSYFIRKVHNRRWGVKPRVVIAIPSGITGVEKKAVISTAERAGAREVYLIQEPMAAGIGVGLPVTSPTGCMIVDIGGGTTEVAVISLGGIVTANSVKIAGDEMDDAIIQHMRKNYNLMIGENTAERIKLELGSVWPLAEEKTMEVKGRDLLCGLPRRAIISSEEIREALDPPVEQSVEAIRETLEKAPPEIAADLVDQGIVMAGGSSQLRGLVEMVAKEVDLPVRLADDPMTAVARGTGEVLEELDFLKSVLETSDD
ncbi:MAG: rod shape-determining protein [Planctomycetes bacterium]|nr:rod shape-determining protein [Planctomycetota bacterium]